MDGSCKTFEVVVGCLSNGKRNEVSIKEWTNPLCPEPSWNSKTLAVLGMPTGEGVPQGLRGWGVRLMGSRGRVPLVGSDKVRGFFAMQGMVWRSQRASQSTSK